MTMRRVSVLLVAVVMMLTMAMGSALANKDNNRAACLRGDTYYFSTHKKQQRFLDNHPRATAGKCHKGKNRGQFIAKKSMGR